MSWLLICLHPPNRHHSLSTTNWDWEIYLFNPPTPTFATNVASDNRQVGFVRKRFKYNCGNHVLQNSPQPQLVLHSGWLRGVGQRVLFLSVLTNICCSFQSWSRRDNGLLYVTTKMKIYLLSSRRPDKSTVTENLLYLNMIG